MKKQAFIQCFLFLLMITHSMEQTLPCESSESTSGTGGTPSITVSLKEASLDDLISNPDDYIADTKINGILGSSDSFAGIALTLSATSSTPSSINLTRRFRLESKALPTPENGFSQRTFIRLMQALDRDGQTPTTFDDLDVIEFQIQCQRVGSQLSIFYLFIIDVLDINDNSPIFTGTPYQSSVNELSPIGTTVFREIAAADLDASDNKLVDFSIVSGNGGVLDGSQKFFIPTPRLGYVVLSSFLDFELLNANGQTYYILNISATDQSPVVSNRKTSYTLLRVDITDEDDLPPSFEVTNCFRIDGVCFNPTYTTELSKTIAVGSTLVLHPRNSPSITESLTVQDRDTLNSSILFSIEETFPKGYGNKFTVTGTGNNGKLYTAALSLAQPIDINTIQDLEIIIKATEISDNRRYERAVIKAMTESNKICTDCSSNNTFTDSSCTDKSSNETFTDRSSNKTCTDSSSNTTCTNTDKCEAPCGNTVVIVGAILGTLLAIVTALFLGYVTKTRKDKCWKSKKDEKPHVYQNDGYGRFPFAVKCEISLQQMQNEEQQSALF